MVRDMFEHLALDPDVFLPSESGSHHDSDAAVRDLQTLMHSGQAMLNLRDGEWRTAISRSGQVSKTGQEFLKAMSQTGRLLPVRTRIADNELGRVDWYHEAIAVKEHDPSLSVCAYVQARPPESGDGSLPRTVASRAWTHIKGRRHTRLSRSVEGYKALLTSVAWRSRTIEVIDAHMDPNKPGYRDIVTALANAATTTSRLGRIQVHFHCCCALKSRNHTPDIEKIAYWENAMNAKWAAVLSQARIKGVAVIWRTLPDGDSHDRFILTPHFMLRCTNGFDTGKTKTMGIQFEEFDTVDDAAPHSTLNEVSKQYNWLASDNQERLLGHFAFGATH